MKRIILVPLFVLAAVSCSPAPAMEDVMRTLDKTLPAVTSHSFERNSILHVSYSETVEVLEIIADGVSLPSGYLGRDFSIPLPRPLSAGESARVNITVRKTNGNMARASFLVTGINDNLPQALINEVSIKGTTTSPDRIEILILQEGNTQGMEIRDGSVSYVLPSIDVRKDDLIVVYWNVRTSRTREERTGGKTTWYLNANASSTLSGTNGILVLSETPEGKVMDALVYSDYTLSSNSGFSSQKLEKEVRDLIEGKEWFGEGVDPTLVTSSRVLARLPGAVDGNNAGDWFITAARKSTFGEMNTYAPYEEN